MRYALRSLARAPGFAAAAIIILALGTGANTGAFSAIRRLLWQSLPYPDPSRLVALFETTRDRKPSGVAEANLLDWDKRARLFDAMAAYRARSYGLTLGDSGAPTVIQTAQTMAALFPPSSSSTRPKRAATRGPTC